MLLAELDARRLLHGMSQSEQHFEQRPIVSVIERIQEWLVRLLRCVASGSAPGGTSRVNSRASSMAKSSISRERPNHSMPVSPEPLLNIIRRAWAC